MEKCQRMTDSIYIGNNITTLNDESLIPTGSVQLCFTSPPYPGFKRGITKAMEKGGGAGYTVGGELNFELMDEVTYITSMCRLFKSMERCAKPYASLMFNIQSPTIKEGEREGCRTLLAHHVVEAVDIHTKWKLYEHMIWYNTVAPPGAFTYKPKPCWEYIFWLVYLPYGFTKGWKKKMVFNKPQLKTAYATTWQTQKRRMESAQGREFSQSGHNIDYTKFFGEGKDLENIFFFNNTRNSETEKAKLVTCTNPDCGEREMIFSKQYLKLLKFNAYEVKKAKAKKRKMTDVFGDDNEETEYEISWTFGCRKCSHEAELVGHGAVFPEALARMIVIGWSNPGDTILDPFMGSGTIAVVTKQFGTPNHRFYYGCDINPNYVELTNEKVRLTTKAVQETLGF